MALAGVDEAIKDKPSVDMLLDNPSTLPLLFRLALLPEATGAPMPDGCSAKSSPPEVSMARAGSILFGRLHKGSFSNADSTTFQNLIRRTSPKCFAVAMHRLNN